VGIALMIAHRAGRGSRIAFGPFLLLGTLIGVLVGEPIAAAYWGGVVG
jgi:leader peptidase (prepilin peptidase)/N-methyltransferase